MTARKDGIFKIFKIRLGGVNLESERYCREDRIALLKSPVGCVTSGSKTE